MINISKGSNLFVGNYFVYNNLLSFLADEFNIVNLSDSKMESPLFTNRIINSKNYKKIIDENLFRVDIISIVLNLGAGSNFFSHDDLIDIIKFVSNKDIPLFVYLNSDKNYKKIYDKIDFLDRYELSIGSSKNFTTLSRELLFSNKKGITMNFDSIKVEYKRDKIINNIIKDE